MSGDRTAGRRKTNRAFRPTLDSALETRALMSGFKHGKYFLNHPAPGVAFVNDNPPFLSAGAHRFPVAKFPRGKSVATQTAHGGQAVIVAAPDGSHFRISLTQFIPAAGQGQAQSSSSATNIPGTQTPIQNQVPGAGVVQPQGTIRAYSMPGGRVGIIVDGSTNQTELDISPQPFPQRRGYAHSFAYGQTNQSHVLNIGQIIVSSGQISAILGYHTAVLSGPVNIASTSPVDRIAFLDLVPGASIATGGDLNTLDVYNSINLSGGDGIFVGRDLNLLNVGQDMNLTNGASLVVSRFMGLVPQPPKGTATGSNFLALNQALLGTGTATTVPSLSANVQGNVNLGPGSVIAIAGGIANSSLTPNSPAGTLTQPSVFLVNGFVNAPGANQLLIPNLRAGTTFFSPIAGIFVPNNFVARQGSNNPFFVRP